MLATPLIWCIILHACAVSVSVPHLIRHRMSHTVSMPPSPSPPSTDLWIVGAGYLGQRVVREWMRAYPGSYVVAETRTPSSHKDLEAAGAHTRLRRDRSLSDHNSAVNVLISIPPYSASGEHVDYISEVQAALHLLRRHDNMEGNCGIGMVLLVSTTAVYGNSSSVVTEFSDVDRDPSNSRAARALAAEDLVLGSSGNSAVVRLAGLYSAERGPHIYWMRSISQTSSAGDEGVGRLSLSPHSLVNLVHYSDAAAAIVQIFRKGGNGRVYMVSDGSPMSRRDIVEASFAALAPGVSVPQFSSKSEHENGGKVCDCRWTRTEIGWVPEFSSFSDFIVQHSDPSNSSFQ